MSLLIVQKKLELSMVESSISFMDLEYALLKLEINSVAEALERVNISDVGTSLNYKFQCLLKKDDLMENKLKQLRLEAEELRTAIFLLEHAKNITPAKGKRLRLMALEYGLKPKWWEYVFEGSLRKRIIKQMRGE